jgi:ribosomal protein L40E
MKVCIHCGRENVDTATTCGGCGKSLSEPETAGANPRDPALDPVVVGTFKTAEEASVLRAWLQSAGIEAWVPEDLSAEYAWEYAHVQVAAKDAQAAGELADEFMKNTEPPPTQKSGAQEGNAAANAAEASAVQVPGRRQCVSCGAWISYDANLCPKCGWTQPQLV